MASLFTSSPLLALFVVVALGAAIGAIRIGPLRFGAAGALFVGLIVSAVHPEVVSMRWERETMCCGPVSYTHLTLPTNSRV